MKNLYVRIRIEGLNGKKIKTLTKKKKKKIKATWTKLETPPLRRTGVDFLGQEREMKGENERAIDDKSFLFRCHIPLMKENTTKKNQMRHHKLILHQEIPYMSPKVSDISYAITTFYI